MIFVALKSELFGSRSISWDEISKNPGNQPMYSNRISSLFTNNPLFNIKPRNQTDALEEEDECSQAGIHEPKPVSPERSGSEISEIKDLTSEQSQPGPDFDRTRPGSKMKILDQTIRILDRFENHFG